MKKTETKDTPMKTLIALLLAPIGIALASTPFGTFSEPTQTFIIGYESYDACKSDGGQWDEEAEMCFFPAENLVNLQEQEGKTILTVDTVGSNGHECHFEGVATALGDGEYLSKVDTTRYEQNDKGEWVEIPTVCEVSLSFHDGNTVTVGNNGECSEFCGARAWLTVDKAIRK